MTYIYFTGEYEDINIKFISEDLSEFKKYVLIDHMQYYMSDNKDWRSYFDRPAYIQIWDKENKCFKTFEEDSKYLPIYNAKTEELNEILEKLN